MPAIWQQGTARHCAERNCTTGSSSILTTRSVTSYTMQPSEGGTMRDSPISSVAACQPWEKAHPSRHYGCAGCRTGQQATSYSCALGL